MRMLWLPGPSQHMRESGDEAVVKLMSLRPIKYTNVSDLLSAKALYCGILASLPK